MNRSIRATFCRKSRHMFLRWLGLLVVGAFLFICVPSSLDDCFYARPLLTAIEVPKNIESKSTKRFNKLVRKGKIFYEESDPETYFDNEFEFQFRTTTVFSHRPVWDPNDPEKPRPEEPLINPEHDEIITELGDTHRLLVNKYNVYKPMFVIPTTDYAVESEDLDISDIEAAWTVLQSFHTPSVMIYNCGVKAGSSQSHKHMQIFPLPKHKIWPSEAASSTDITVQIPNVPFKHFVLAIPHSATPLEVYRAYHRLLFFSRGALADHLASRPEYMIENDYVLDSADYNVVMTRNWIAVIPRRSAGTKEVFGVDAKGMLGLVAVSSLEQRNEWHRLNYTMFLSDLGVPF